MRYPSTFLDALFGLNFFSQNNFQISNTFLHKFIFYFFSSVKKNNKQRDQTWICLWCSNFNICIGTSKLNHTDHAHNYSNSDESRHFHKYQSTPKFRNNDDSSVGCVDAAKSLKILTTTFICCFFLYHQQ